MKHLQTDLAYQHCRKIALGHYENFPVGSLLVPSHKRRYIYSIYAFARYADDIADSDSIERSDKHRELAILENELSKIEGSGIQEFVPETELIFIAIADTIRQLNIPIKEFRDLLSAFRQDSEGKDYQTFDQLIEYSSRSANPIGHLVLNVFGYSRNENEEMFRLSDNICTALQLTNFWQDVSQDLKIGRVYIPEESMIKHNYSHEELKRKNENDDFRSMIRDLCNRTESFFREGEGLPDMTAGRLRLELKATLNGGRKILKKIQELNYNVLNRRPELSAIDKISIMIKAFF